MLRCGIKPLLMKPWGESNSDNPQASSKVSQSQNCTPIAPPKGSKLHAGTHRSITPTQPIAIDEYYPTQNTPVINAGLAMALGKERFKTGHLRVRQPEKVAH